MLLLAVETTATTGSLVLAQMAGNKPQVLSLREWQKKSSHSDVITLEFSAALDDAGKTLADVTHLAVDVGPGSFTGIRVGVNFIRTMAYARSLPVQIFSSLEVMAFQELGHDQSAVVAIPAVQNFMYAGAYRRTAAGVDTLRPAESWDERDLDQLRAETNIQTVLRPQREPSAQTLAEMFVEPGRTSKFLTWENVKPLYIRRSEAEEKLRKGLLKPLPQD